jgi:Gpi18-like mannosyltransferase
LKMANKFFDSQTLSILKLAILVKLALIVFVYFFHSLIPLNQRALESNYFYRPASFKLGQLLSAWDGQWYVSLSEQWYQKDPVERIDLAKYVDYPLYPALMRVISQSLGIDSYLTGILISMTCSIIGAVLLFKVTQNYFSLSVARKSTILFLFSPMAIFFSAIYTESLFFALTLASIYMTQKHKWFGAGFLGLLASLTRSIGLLSLIVLIPLAVAHCRRTLGLTRYYPIFTLVLVAAGFIGFTLYASYMTGIPDAYTQAQQYFGRSAPSFTNLTKYTLTTLFNFTKYPLHGIFHSKLEVFTIISLIALSVIYAKKLTLPLTLYNLSLILLTLSSGTSTAIIRYLAASFPIYILLALAAKKTIIYTTLKYVFILLQSLFAIMYVNWYWVS